MSMHRGAFARARGAVDVRGSAVPSGGCRRGGGRRSCSGSRSSSPRASSIAAAALGSTAPRRRRGRAGRRTTGPRPRRPTRPRRAARAKETIASTSADPTGIDATGAVTDATTGMRGESDDPGQCADEGTSCDDASPCCGGCLSCKGGVCVADDAICGECQVCSTLGACVLAPPDTACGGVIDCAGVVWGLGGPYEDLCFAAAGGAQGRCDAGECARRRAVRTARRRASCCSTAPRASSPITTASPAST